MRKAEERGREKARYGQGKAADLPNRSVLHFSPSPPKRPHQFCLRQDMTFHGRVDILAVDWGVQVQSCVQGIKPEKIPVGFAGRGTGAAVTIHREVVDALLAAARNGFARAARVPAIAAPKPAGCTPPSEPRFRQGASGSSTISTKLWVRGGGWVPGKRRRDVCPAARKLRGDRTARVERRGLQFQLSGRILGYRNIRRQKDERDGQD